MKLNKSYSKIELIVNFPHQFSSLCVGTKRHVRVYQSDYPLS